jgi:hypothetical protein
MPDRSEVRGVHPPRATVIDDELIQRVQRASEEHLDACMEAMWGIEDDVYDTSPAMAPFCGCTTCIVREVLYAAWKVLDPDATWDAP